MISLRLCRNKWDNELLSISLGESNESSFEFETKFPTESDLTLTDLNV
jgi:hypothetical protein